MMQERDLYQDYVNDDLNRRLVNIVREQLRTNGLFGTGAILDLYKYFLAHLQPYHQVDSLSSNDSKKLMLSYLDYVNNPPNFANISRISKAYASKSDCLASGEIVVRHGINTFDLASSSVNNIGAEAKILLLHAIFGDNLINNNKAILFHTHSKEYTRSIISKYNIKEYSHEAIDIIAQIPTTPKDLDIVIYLVFTAYVFTCIKTFGWKETNAQCISEMAGQLRGTGVIILDYYFKKIEEAFKDTELVINYDLLNAMYVDTDNIAFNIKSTIFDEKQPLVPETRGVFLDTIYSLFQSDAPDDKLRLYQETLMLWRDLAILPKGKIKDELSYLKLVKNMDFKYTTAFVNSDGSFVPHPHFRLIKMILEFSPDLQDVITLSDIYNALVVRGDVGTEPFVWMDKSNVSWPAWKHCLMILLHLHIDKGTRLKITRQNLISDICKEIQFYNNLYDLPPLDQEYKYMLSP